MKNLENLLDKNIVKDILLPYRKELQLSENFEVREIKRFMVLAAETYVLSIEVNDGGQTYIFRGNASEKDSRSRSSLIINALNDINFVDNHFFIPQNVVYIEDYNLIIYKQIEGEIFYKNLNIEPNLLEEKVKLCAQWLSKLHSSKISLNLPPYNFTFERNHLLQDFPEIAQKLDQTVNEAKENLKSDQKVIIHGDFQPNNIIFEGQRIAVIDFNDAAYDSPMIDVAGFLCQLHTMLLRKADEGIFAKLSKIFLSEYQKEILIGESMLNDLKIYQSLYYLKIFSSLNASNKSGVDTVSATDLENIYQFSQGDEIF